MAAIRRMADHIVDTSEMTVHELRHVFTGVAGGRAPGKQLVVTILSFGFKQEWLAHGGVEAFGYPITEEFSGVTPDGRRYVAQIFERARFEWWPDKVGTPEEITYGLLVTELLRQAGWVP